MIQAGDQLGARLQSRPRRPTPASDGMAVAVRSLADGKPLSGVTLRLYARNNGELAPPPTDADGLAHIRRRAVARQGRRRAFRGDGAWPRRRLQLPRGRPRRFRSERPRASAGARNPARSMPFSTPIAASTGRARPSHLMVALVRDDKADAMSGLPVTLAAAAAGRDRGREAAADRRSSSACLPAELCPAARRPHRALGRSSCGSTRRRRRSASRNSASRILCRRSSRLRSPPRDGPIRPAEAFSVDDHSALLLRRAGGRACGRGRGGDRPSTIIRFRASPGFRFGLVDEEFAGDRKDLDAPATDDDGKSTAVGRPDRSARLDAAARCDDRVSVFEPSGRAVSRDADPADPAARARHRAALAGRRRRRPGGRRGEIRRHRSRRRRASASQRRGCAGSCCARTGNTAGTRSTACGVTRSHIREPADRHRQLGCRRRSSGKPVAATAGRALSLGGHGRRERRPIEPALSCRLVGRGRVARRARQADGDARQDQLSAGRNRQALHQGAVCRRGRAGDRFGPRSCRCGRSTCLPAARRSTSRSSPSWGSGVYALVTAYRPSAPPAAGGTAPRRADRGGRSASPGSAIDRGAAHACCGARPRPMSPARAVRSRFRSRSPGSPPGEEAYVTLAAVDEAVLKLTDFDSPAPAELLLRQAASSGSNCATSTAG